MNGLDLTGRVALVTGASRGIGRAVARRLAAEGVKVAIGYRSSREDALALSAELSSAGPRAIAVGGDVSDPSELHRVVDEAELALGAIDILVSNAGTAEPHRLDELTVDVWDATMSEHLRAAFLLTQRLTPGMRERGFGRAVLISSVAAFTGGVIGPHYAAAKAGLIGLMHSLASSLASSGVTVNVVAPALIDRAGNLAGGDEERRRRMTARVPLGRLGRVDEVADLTVAVVRNGYLTNQTLLIDGGVHPR